MGEPAVQFMDLDELKMDLTDAGNATVFARLAEGKLLWVSDSERWFWWDGSRWAPDENLYRYAVAREIGPHFWDLGRGMAGKAGDICIKHAADCHAAHRMRAAIDLARGELGMSVSVDGFDTHDTLLTVKNGTIDLTTGELTESSPKNRITKRVDIDYDPKATCPRWREFLSQVLPQPGVPAFLQRAVGYSLTGSTDEQCMFILHGAGANGKTVLLETVKAVCGDNATQARSEILLATNRDKATHEYAELRGARMVVTSETPENRRLDEQQVKLITGGDEIAARHMYKENFRYRPKFKIWMATNYLPEIQGTDDGIWRRLRLIPFKQSFTDDTVPPRDPKLREALDKELPGILAWAVQGALDWQRDGLDPPDSVVLATKHYKQSEDIVAEFIEERCRRDDTARVRFADLYAAFEEYCQGNDERPMSKKSKKWLGRRLDLMGFESVSGARNAKFREGLHLLSVTHVTDGG
jgi:putative DNA primase/helicase